MKASVDAIEFVTAGDKINNDSLKESFPNYNFDKFEKKVGIKSRFVLKDGETAFDLAIKAVEKLIQANNLDKKSIDFVIHCTQSPEFMLPTSACIIQDKCGITEQCGAFDINLGCSGYTYGLILSKSLIESGIAQKIILITSDSYSKYINKGDLINRLIFGDAASATLITCSSKNPLHNFNFGTSGAGWDKLLVRNNFFNVRKGTISNKTYGAGNIYTDDDLYMDGPAVFNFTIDRIPPLVKNVLKSNNLTEEQLHTFIPHQANAFLLKSITNLSGIETSKLFINLENYGNTVSSTIPIALKEYSLNNFDEVSKNVLLAGFGVGLSWSAGILNLNTRL